MEMAVKLLMLVMLMFIKGAFAQTANRSLALPGCRERCGSLVVPYPFGMGANCQVRDSMTIYCNNSFNPPKAFLRDRRQKYLEVLDISLEAATVRINYPITTDCTDRNNDPDIYLNEPFSFSNTENRFTAMGCDTLALLRSATSYGGCLSACSAYSAKKENNCFGIDCCQTKLAPFLSFIHLSLNSTNGDQSLQRCDRGPRYAFIVDQNWFEKLKDIYSVKTMDKVPVVLKWKTEADCRLQFEDWRDINQAPNMCGTNALCTDQSLCSCRKGYQGNPYLSDGCQDIDECATHIPGSSLKRNRCQHFCTNTPGNYTCSCKDGWVLVGNFECVKLEVNIHSVKKEVDHRLKIAAIVIGTCAGLGVLLVATSWLYKFIRRRNIRKLKKKFFERNGGLLLRQQVSSSQDNVETTKVFTSKELEKATDRYNVDRIIGQGGQGTVYKGMLTDGRIVAVKKSKIEDESKLEHFINEVIILSQINHRNIVKLHGCCLETEVPLLVYEFIPNGTLMQYIHEENEHFPLSWDVRLRVATEIAGALYYLHSVASIPVYHRDIKSTNILLDDKYKAKVADFGTSKSFSIDETHLTTRVQGTFGYLDPEYFQSSQFTDKSDVYNFGVVLVELLTGQKPILAARLDDEARGLAKLFLLAMEESRLLDIIDSRIVNEGKKEEMIAFANIAYRCLNLNGRKRPTMKQVVVELESIRYTHESPIAQQNYEEVEYGNHEPNASRHSDVTSSSMSCTLSHSLSVNIEPLMTY